MDWICYFCPCLHEDEDDNTDTTVCSDTDTTVCSDTNTTVCSDATTTKSYSFQGNPMLRSLLSEDD